LIQRKPQNRLGLRGAQEVKDHAWVKYFPWKDLYDKNLSSPFLPKSSENFDTKYCNAPDKIGINTKEKYDQITMNEMSNPSFDDFLFYYNEHDSSDPSNSKEKKFYNPHTALHNSTSIKSLSNDSDMNQENSISQVNSLNKRATASTSSKNIENKFNKIKQMSNSGSANSLYSKAIQGSSFGSNTTGSASSSSSYVFKKTGSISNYKY
jgi:hypothetical protein